MNVSSLPFCHKGKYTAEVSMEASVYITNKYYNNKKDKNSRVLLWTDKTKDKTQRRVVETFDIVFL